MVPISIVEDETIETRMMAVGRGAHSPSCRPAVPGGVSVWEMRVSWACEAGEVGGGRVVVRCALCVVRRVLGWLGL